MVYNRGISNNTIYHGRRFESNITNYQIQEGGWEIPALQSAGLLWLKVFLFCATACSCSIIDDILPFSIGKATQGAYYPPHCRYITPYDDMVRNHKKKQKLQQEFAMIPPSVEEGAESIEEASTEE